MKMRKIFILTTVIMTSFVSYAQSLGYNDLGILFNQDEQYGTSRFNAMSGAFGALGSDISAIGINPAGGAVSRHSSITITAGNRNSNVDATYYGKKSNSQEDNFTLSQLGGILSFEKTDNSDWNRFAVCFNYRTKNNFDKLYTVQGNSGEALFNEHPNDTSTPKNKYNNAQKQQFTNKFKGKTSVFTIGVSSVYQKKIFVGANLNIHNIRLDQNAKLNETNKDNKGNTLTAFNEQKSAFNGSGVSLSFGFIYKPIQNIRLGLAYESPTWYQEITEESNLAVFDPKDTRYDDWLGYTNIHANNISTDINSGEEITTYVFKLKTPNRFTVSAAYIFNKKGLISIDYTRKGYKTTQFSNGDFDVINKNFTNDYKNTNAVNIGTEWRFDKLSLRGGYHYEQTPYKSNLEGNISGYSLGVGYIFGNTKFDLAYQNTSYKNSLNIYKSPNINVVNPITMNTDNSRITATLTIGL